MYQLVQHKEAGLAVSTALSVVFHAAVFALLIWWQQMIPNIPVETTYYVDVVNLPVMDPRSGNPTQTGNEEVPAAQPETPPPAMAVPAATGKSPVVKKNAPPADSKAFLDSLSKLEGKVDSRRQAAAFEDLKKKVAAKGKVGMPRGTGGESGSDYTSYLHSRLKDAFRETISYQSKEPFVVVRLSIDGDGRIIRTRFEKSSGDRVFELSVTRAITLAEQSIVPPPGRSVYEGGFVFKPQGVVQR